MRFNKYSKEDFIKAVASSTSIRQVLISLNVESYGGNYRTAKNYIEKLSLDTSHFLGQGWNKGKSPNIYQDRTTEDYLNNKYPIQSNKLRLRLLKDGYLEHKCYLCENTEWNGKPIPIELEHIDGNNQNNELSNLTILCPNCHAQTATYRGKNISK